MIPSRRTEPQQRDTTGIAYKDRNLVERFWSQGEAVPTGGDPVREDGPELPGVRSCGLDHDLVAVARKPKVSWALSTRPSNQGFLERMARSDELVDHDGETCGQCHNMILGAEVAREMIEAGEYEDVVSKWAAETQAALGSEQVLQAVAGRKEGRS